MEELVETLFGKKFNQLVLEDIESFFEDEKEEDELIEFKTGLLKDFDSIVKEVVAFLNTNGGLLFIGTPKEQKKTIGKSEVKVCKGKLELSSWKNKEQIQQKILTGISPPPTSFKIHEILTPEGNFFIVAVSPT